MKKNTIKFTDFSIEKNCVEFKVHDFKNNTKRIFDAYIRFNQPFIPSNNSLAAALITACPKSCKKIMIDLSFSLDVAEHLSKTTHASIKSNIGIINNTKYLARKLIKKTKKPVIQQGSADQSWKKTVPSGIQYAAGFDSLAAQSLLSESAELIFIPENFSHSISAEAASHNIFDVHGVFTNLSDYGYLQEIAPTMFSSILYKELLYVRCNDKLPNGKQSIKEWDIKQITGGFTEAGTAALAMYYQKDNVRKTIKFLEKDSTEKKYRRQLLASIAAERFKTKIDLGSLIPPEVKPAFGQYPASDFLIFYLIKKLGSEAVQEYMSGIPQEVFDMTDNMKLNFYARYNTEKYIALPNEIRAAFISKLSDAGIMLYDETDWQEYRIVSEYLLALHKQK